MKKYFLSLLFIGCSLFSCKKQDEFLDKVPNIKLAVISSLSDVQALLRATPTFNANDPSIHLVTGEEFNTTDAFYNGFSPKERKLLTWDPNPYPGEPLAEWNGLYGNILVSNSALEALDKIPVDQSQQQLANNLKGAALFFRARAHFIAMYLFSLPFDSATASTDLGVPLRLSSDLNIKSTRATQQQCYNQIIADLTQAVGLLPDSHTYLSDPTSISANALLAKVYLTLGDYSKALSYANAVLTKFNILTDYNTLTSPTSTAISANNYLSEDIFHSFVLGYSPLAGSRKVVDTALYNLYENNDLRKNLFWFTSGGRTFFRGSYEKTGALYDGIATDEIYLIRAECYARAGNTTSAMADLNTLVRKRYVTNTYTDRTAATADDALKLILTERRKELCFRGIRWSDLRRLNKDPRFSVTLKRVLVGQTYTLPPNDKRYAFLIPDVEIKLSGIQQNPR